MENQSKATELQVIRQQAETSLINSPIEYWESINPKTALDVFNSPCVSISTLVVQKSEIWVQAIMVKLMNNFIEFYSTANTMSATQVAETIQLILEVYPHYCLEDLKLFFKMAKKGNLGKIYGRMDGEVIMDWIKGYDEYRTLEAERLSIKEQEYYKELANAENQGAEFITYQEYIETKKLAESGDKDAINKLTPP